MNCTLFARRYRHDFIDATLRGAMPSNHHRMSAPCRVIYTTNAIEAFHRQLHKVIRTKGSFTSDSALMKLLFPVQSDITQQWQRPMHNGNRIPAQLTTLYNDCLQREL